MEEKTGENRGNGERNRLRKREIGHHNAETVKNILGNIIMLLMSTNVTIVTRKLGAYGGFW